MINTVLEYCMRTPLYIHSDQLSMSYHNILDTLLLQVLILQKHWRRWLAEQYVSSLQAERQRRIEWEKQVTNYCSY